LQVEPFPPAEEVDEVIICAFLRKRIGAQKHYEGLTRRLIPSRFEDYLAVVIKKNSDGTTTAELPTTRIERAEPLEKTIKRAAWEQTGIILQQSEHHSNLIIEHPDRTYFRGDRCLPIYKGFGLQVHPVPPSKDRTVEFLPVYKAIKLLEKNPYFGPVAKFLLESSQSFIDYLYSKQL